MTTTTKINRKYSFEEYVAFEQESDSRHEFQDGVLIPIEATTKNHNTIITNFLLNANIPQLRKNGCQLFHENVITAVASHKRGVYPDIVVTCNKENQKDTLVVRHPKLIVEVLSKSTASYDKTGKFFKYQRIPSLMQYVLISQYAYAVEHYTKMDNGQWIYTALDQLDSVLEIPCIDLVIPLAALYEAIILDNS